MHIARRQAAVPSTECFSPVGHPGRFMGNAQNWTQMRPQLLQNWSTSCAMSSCVCDVESSAAVATNCSGSGVGPPVRHSKLIRCSFGSQRALQIKRDCSLWQAAKASVLRAPQNKPGIILGSLS